MALAHGVHLANVFHGDGLASAGVVGHGDHDQRDMIAAHALNQRFERSHVHVALERMRRCRLPSFRDYRSAASAPMNSTLARVVSKCVLLGTTSPCLAGDTEQDALGRASLVRGDHVLIAENVLNGILETDEASAPA